MIGRLTLLLLLAAPAALAQPIVLKGQELASVNEAHCSNPNVSPDGVWVAYEVNVSSKRREQHIISLKDRRDRRVSPKLSSRQLLQRLKKKKGANVCHELSWRAGPQSPFVLSCNDSGGRYQLFQAAHAGQVPSPIQGSKSLANDFVPSVMGDWVAFSSDRSGHGDLYARHLTDNSERQLTSSAEDAELSPVWSPSGAGVAYVRHLASGGDDDLYYVSASGGQPIQLTRSRATEFQPQWSPDGTHLAYLLATKPGAPVDLHVARFDPATGLSDDQTMVKGIISGDRRGFDWTPDGKGILIVRHADPINPLQIIWLSSPDKPVVLNTGTLQNSDPSVAVDSSGVWRIVWAAQAKTTDKEKRWTRIYTAQISPDRLGGR